MCVKLFGALGKLFFAFRDCAANVAIGVWIAMENARACRVESSSLFFSRYCLGIGVFCFANTPSKAT